MYIHFRTNNNHLHQWYISLACLYLIFLKVREVSPQSYFVTTGCRQLLYAILYLIQNNQAVKKSVALKKAMVKKDVKSKVAAKKWL